MCEDKKLEDYRLIQNFFESNEKEYSRDPKATAGYMGNSWIFFGNVIEWAPGISLSRKLMHEIYMENRKHIDKVIEKLKEKINADNQNNLS